MTLIQFFRLFSRNFNLFILASIALAVLVFLLTRNLPKQYSSETEVFTGIASGVNIESVGTTTIDYFTTNTEYDNLINIIKSRQTLEEVGMRLLIQHMLLDSAHPKIINQENYGHFKYKMPDSLVREILDTHSVENTLRRLRNYRANNFLDDKVQFTFENGNSPYSHQAISSVEVSRIQGSDILRLRYTWNDPGIAQQTLAILNKVFTKNMALIKSGQSNEVVSYFQEQVDKAAALLSEAEQRLQEFRITNRVINYQEQTRSLSIQKENMENEYQAELARKEAAEAVLNRLNQQLALNNMMIELGQDILEKKNELVEVRTQIAELEVYLNDPDLLRLMSRKAMRLEEEVRNLIMERFQYSRTVDGVPIQSVIELWLNASLELEEMEARLKVYARRKAYFADMYDEFAPLGSQFARMEREIGIAEQNYLELLNSLNQALLRQRSESISSGGLVVMVEPNFPLSPQKSKALLLVLVAAVIGFITPFVVVVLRELLDSALRTPEKAGEETGLNLLGAYPDLTKRREVQKVDFSWLHQKATSLSVQNLRLLLTRKGVSDRKVQMVLLSSTREGDGKQLMAHVLANELVSYNFRVMVLGPKEIPKSELPYYDYFSYKANRDFVNCESITELSPLISDPGLYDFCFFLLPSITTNPYPVALLRQFPVALLVVGAFRDWNAADRSALRSLEESLGYKPELIVNAVEPDYMVSVLGEIKKERTIVRRLLKRILSLQLRSKRVEKSA